MSPPRRRAQHVSVRMYDVGFGDAFLVTLPPADRPRRMLVDCGTHFMGPGPRPIEDVIAQIRADATDKDGTVRIDVVVATHRHQDHVSGFAKPLWDDVEVGEVWMPWTEDPDDAEATRIRERQSALAAGLCLTLEAAGEESTALALARNSLTNEPAMSTLHRGFSGRPPRRFLPTADIAIETLEVPALPGATVHVLGPSRDPRVIRDMDPPSGQSYLKMVEPSVAGAVTAPFGPEWTLEPKEIANDPRLAHQMVRNPQLGILRGLAREDLSGLAATLEKSVNGTSLVFVLEIGDAVLLFAGDAQWGTWRRILETSEMRELVGRTTFLKVGHHGSHNATPKDLVKLFSPRRTAADSPVPDMWAMVSTRPMERWKNIPKAELVTALGGLAERFARSDSGRDGPADGFERPADGVIEARIPLRARSRRR